MWTLASLSARKSSEVRKSAEVQPPGAGVAAGAPRASCAGHARRQACERLSAGWRVPAEPTMLRLNSHLIPRILGLTLVY